MKDSAITLTSAQVSDYYVARVPHLKQRQAAEWRGACPIHGGDGNNFAVDPKNGDWFCHSQCGRGGDILELEKALTGADFLTAKVEVFQIIGRANSPNQKRPARSRIATAYDYTDEAGRLRFQVVRLAQKGFKQRRPDAKGGWIWNLKGVKPVLYRLTDLLRRNTETVFVCEGEKDVHCLEAWGLLATCNPMGAGKWRAAYAKSLQGRAVVILPDNDAAGRKHAAAVAVSLLSVAASVRRTSEVAREGRR